MNRLQSGFTLLPDFLDICACFIVDQIFLFGRFQFKISCVRCDQLDRWINTPLSPINIQSWNWTLISSGKVAFQQFIRSLPCAQPSVVHSAAHRAWFRLIPHPDVFQGVQWRATVFVVRLFVGLVGSLILSLGAVGFDSVFLCRLLITDPNPKNPVIKKQLFFKSGGNCLGHSNFNLTWV